MCQLFSCLPVRFSASSTKFTEIKSTTLQIETFISKGFLKFEIISLLPSIYLQGEGEGQISIFARFTSLTLLLRPLSLMLFWILFSPPPFSSDCWPQVCPNVFKKNEMQCNVFIMSKRNWNLEVCSQKHAQRWLWKM